MLIKNILLKIWDHLSGKARTRKMVEEFAFLFPGKCMICSFHRYGLEHRLTDKKSPDPHECIDWVFVPSHDVGGIAVPEYWENQTTFERVYDDQRPHSSPE